MRKTISILFALALVVGMTLLPAVVAAGDDIYVTEGHFRESGGGSVAWSGEQAAVGDWSVKLVHNFAAGGHSRVLLERTAESLMTFGDIEEWSYWVYLANTNGAFCPGLTFYLDVGDAYDYYTGTNVNVILTIRKSKIATFAWEQIRSDGTWGTSALGAMLYTVSTGWGPVRSATSDPLTWQSFVSGEIKYGFGATVPTIDLSEADVVGILIDYPAGLGSSQTITAYLDDFALNDVTYVFERVVCADTFTATDTGEAVFCASEGFVEALTPVDEATLPTEGKPNLQFPHGFFALNVVGVTPGATVTVAIRLPQPAHPGTQYWKYYNDAWHQIPMTIDSTDNRIIHITLVDGGLGDADLTENGTIIDQGGPGNPWPVTVGWDARPVSKLAVLTPWIALFAVMMAGGGLLVLRRRRAQI